MAMWKHFHENFSGIQTPDTQSSESFHIYSIICNVASHSKTAAQGVCSLDT